MADESNPIGKQPFRRAWVWYTGTDVVAEGTAVCYKSQNTHTRGDGSATTTSTPDETRGNSVSKPTTSVNNSFAGVAAAGPWNSVANSGGQPIQIYLPGSFCNVLLSGSQTIGERAQVTYITASNTAANVGKWRLGGLPGQGSAQLLQTVTGSVLAQVRLLEGDQCGGIEELLPVTGAAAQFQVGGVTALQAVTIAADCTVNTLADGTIVGQRKRFIVDGTIVTSDYLVTVTTGVKIDGTTAITTIAFDTAAENALLEWDGVQWFTVAFKGATFA